MINKLILAWAITATALTLVLLGSHLEKRGQVETALYTLPDAATHTETNGRKRPHGPGTDEAPVYQIPTSMASMATQWHSMIRASDKAGYAILFDPNAKELIVEQCQQPIYFRHGQPVGEVAPFCEIVLWGTLMELHADKAIVRSPDGQLLKAKLTLHADTDNPTLSIAFAQHKMTLIPGSKNDFLQVFEQRPEVRQQRHQVYSYEATLVAAQRASDVAKARANPSATSTVAGAKSAPPLSQREMLEIEAQRALDTNTAQGTLDRDSDGNAAAESLPSTVFRYSLNKDAIPPETQPDGFANDERFNR